MNKQVIFSRHSRRQFIRYSSLALGSTALTGPYLLRARNLNDKVNIAQIGAGGKGESDTECCSAEKKVITQMGNQGSSESGLRRAVEIIQAGAIGPVRQVHVWSNRPIWPQGLDRPPGSDSMPETLDWDVWIGPAPMRPFKDKVYHPFAWRGWQDFGTGALGDM